MQARGSKKGMGSSKAVIRAKKKESIFVSNFCFPVDFCIGLGSVSFKCWVSQSKGIKFQGFSFTITTFCLLPPREQWLLNTFDFLTWKGQSDPRSDTLASLVWLSLFGRVTRDQLFLFPVPVGGRFVTIIPQMLLRGWVPAQLLLK